MRTSLLAALVLLLAVSAASARSLPAERLANTANGVLTDGRATVAVRTAAGDLRLSNVRTRRRSTLDVPEGCEAQALSFGHLLVDCRTGATPAPRIVDLRMGAQSPIAGLDRENAALGATPSGSLPPTYSVTGFGRHWVELTASGNHVAKLRYLNWRSGEGIDEPAGTGVVPDLDRPGLRRVLCAPLRRASYGSASEVTGSAYGPLKFRPPTGALVLGPLGGPAFLGCGRPGPVRLRCGLGCGSVDISGAAIGFTLGGDAFVEDAFERRSWRVRAGARGDADRVELLDCAALVRVDEATSAAPFARGIYVARLPKPLQTGSC